MRKLWLVVAIGRITIAPAEVASTPREDAIIECLIGKAAKRLFAFELRRWEAQLENSINRHRYTP